MNITLSTDKDTIQRTRKYARQRGTSLNQLVRDYLHALTKQGDRDASADEFVRNATAHCGRSPKGYRFDREQAHRNRD